jgi:hypothetical protein
VDPRSSSKTFRQHAENWLKAQSPDPATREILRSRLESQIYPRFGGMTVGQIKPATIRDWLGNLEEKKRAENYKVVLFTLVSAALDSAIDDKLIRENPARRRLCGGRPARVHRSRSGRKIACTGSARVWSSGFRSWYRSARAGPAAG